MMTCRNSLTAAAAASRDVNYTAIVGDLTISAGLTDGDDDALSHAR